MENSINLSPLVRALAMLLSDQLDECEFKVSLTHTITRLDFDQAVSTCGFGLFSACQ